MLINQVIDFDDRRSFYHNALFQFIARTVQACAVDYALCDVASNDHSPVGVKKNLRARDRKGPLVIVVAGNHGAHRNAGEPEDAGQIPVADEEGVAGLGGRAGDMRRRGKSTGVEHGNLLRIPAR